MVKINYDGVYGICPKGGEHQWRTDGAHLNKFCGKCFADKPDIFVNSTMEDCSECGCRFHLDACEAKVKVKNCSPITIPVSEGENKGMKNG